MTTYVLDWSNPVKPTISLDEQTINTTDTSLKLVGKFYPGYGELQQENLLRMLEHFSSDAPPAHPTEGQFWYDLAVPTMKVWDGAAWILATSGVESGDMTPTNPSDGSIWYDTFHNALNVWDGAAWRQVYPPVNAGETIKVAYITEYNAMVGAINQISGTPAGSSYANATGYGQTPFAFASGTLSNDNWVQLLDRVKNVALHQGLSPSLISNISNTGFIVASSETITKGVVTLIQEYVNTVTVVNGLNATRFQAAPLSLESSTPISGTKVKSTSWNGTITHEMVLAYQNANAAKAHFNAGGKLLFNVTIPNSPSSLVNGEWDTMLAGIGTITINAQNTSISGTGALGTTAKGFYDLTTGYQTIFTRSTTGANAQGNIKVEAKMEASGSAIRVLITLTSTGVVTAQSTSSVSIVKAGSAYLNSPIQAYPSVSSGGTWDSSAPPSTVYRPTINTASSVPGGITTPYTLSGGNPNTSIVVVGDNGNGVQTYNYTFNSVGSYNGVVNFAVTAAGNYTWTFTFSDGYVLTQVWSVTTGAAYCAGTSTSRTFVATQSYPQTAVDANTNPGAIYESTCMQSTSTVQLQSGTIPPGMNLVVASDSKVHLFGTPTTPGSYSGSLYVSFPSSSPVTSALVPFSVTVSNAPAPFNGSITQVDLGKTVTVNGGTTTITHTIGLSFSGTGATGISGPQWSNTGSVTSSNGSLSPTYVMVFSGPTGTQKNFNVTVNASITTSSGVTQGPFTNTKSYSYLF